jgi:hypothetical protein
MSGLAREKTFRFVIHDRVLDYARLGWTIEDTMEDCHHGQYSILMEWLCNCPLVEPRKRSARGQPERY